MTIQNRIRRARKIIAQLLRLPQSKAVQAELKWWYRRIDQLTTDLEYREMEKHAQCSTN
jgi:hypothetical protein